MQDTIMQTVSFQLFLWALGVSSLYRFITKCILTLCMVVMYVGSRVQQHLEYSRVVRQVSVRELIVCAVLYRYVVHI